MRDRGDAERGLERVFSPPNRSTWDVDGWATVAPDAPDSAIDALVGVRGRFDSSARFEGRPGFRASSAFDGTSKPWIGSWQDGRRTWIEWTGGAERQLTLDPVPGVRRPTRVRIGAATIDVGADGVVRLPAPVRGRVPDGDPARRVPAGHAGSAAATPRGRDRRDPRRADRRGAALRRVRLGLRRVRADGRRGRCRRERDRAVRRSRRRPPPAHQRVRRVRPAGGGDAAVGAPRHVHAVRAPAAHGPERSPRPPPAA